MSAMDVLFDRAEWSGQCQHVSPDMFAAERHADDHQRGQLGVTRDNCRVCALPIRLTKAAVLRVHGPAGERCPGGGEVGRFVLRCTGRAALIPVRYPAS